MNQIWKKNYSISGDLAVRYVKYDKNLPHGGIIVDASHKYLSLKDLYKWIYLHNITVN